MIDPYNLPPSGPHDATEPTPPLARAQPVRPAVVGSPSVESAGPEGPARTRKPAHVYLARASGTCAVLIVLALLLMFVDRDLNVGIFFVVCGLASLQLLLGLTAVISKIVYCKRGGVNADWVGLWAVLWILSAPGLWILSIAGLLTGGWTGSGGWGGGFGGGAWGRPLRIKGQQRHPNLRQGADWTAGERPNPAGLDAPTRAALEALWLHDAQKEHASVPAFTRVSWLLAAVGAPADLLLWCHRAAMEEIDHTQRCFALAAGYAGRSFTVEPMPDLLLDGLGSKTDPLVLLAVESLSDGCQLEDYNADVAARCAAVCTEPATRDVLDRIAREERTHAEFSWAVLGWVLQRDRARVLPHLHRALAALDRYPRPTAVSAEKAALVAQADVAALRRHGRISDAEWAEAWTQRLAATRVRAGVLFGEVSHIESAAAPLAA